MADLAYNAALNAGTRSNAKLEIAFNVGATPLVYETVPARTRQGGYRPNVSVNRQPLFGTTGGSAVTVITEGGSLGFSTIAPPTNGTVNKMFLKVGDTDTTNHNVMFRYTDGNGLPTQGQAVLTYQGEAGDGPNETTAYDWTLEVIAVTQTLPAVTP